MKENADKKYQKKRVKEIYKPTNVMMMNTAKKQLFINLLFSYLSMSPKTEISYSMAV